MIKETYTFKEILFGLRNEYLRITSQLNSLQKYLHLKENGFESINFQILKNSDNQEISLMCILIDRQTKLEKLLYRFIKNLGIYPDNQIDYIKELEDDFVFCNYHQLLKVESQKEFTRDIINIYNDEFIQNMQNTFYGVGYENVPYLSLLPHSIYISEANHLAIDYDLTKGDYLHINSIHHKISNELIEASFNMTIPKRRIPEYYQNIIESSETKDNQIDIIGDINGFQTVNLKIIEEPKKLILKKF